MIGLGWFDTADPIDIDAPLRIYPLNLATLERVKGIEPSS